MHKLLPMRVLIINTSERIGGAAIAASRLMESLKNNGIKAKMLVRDKQTDQISVVRLKSNWLQVWKFMWERIVIWSANRFRRYHLFDVDIANTGTDITSLPEFRQADVIHLHWINQGMLSLNDIRKILTSGKPVVWICTICGHAPASAITHGSATTISRNVTTVRTSTKAGDERIYPIARSAKNRSYTATLPFISSRAAIG